MEFNSNNNTKLVSLGIICLFAAFFMGTWIRVRGVVDFPFLADEAYITQNGVRDMFGVGPDQHLDSGWMTQVFGVPLRNGQFLGPLWWWMQSSVFELIPGNDQILFVGADNKLYRILPLIWGILGIAVFYRLAKLNRPSVEAKSDKLDITLTGHLFDDNILSNILDKVSLRLHCMIFVFQRSLK